MRSYGDKRKATIFLAASDAPADQKARAHAVCPGSHDEAVIQSYIDQLAVGDGGVVELSSGAFSCGLAAGQTAYDGSALDGTLTKGAVNIDVYTAAGLDTAKFAVGDLVFLKDYAANTDVTDARIDNIYTVMAISVGVSISLNTSLSDASVAHVAFEKVLHSIGIVPVGGGNNHVTVRGQGVEVTRLNLAAAANCALVAFKGTSHGNVSFGGIGGMSLNGTHHNQTGTLRTMAGVIFNAFVIDFRIWDLFPYYFKGDGIVINQGWGGVIERGVVVEWNKGYGLVGVYGSSLAATNIKIMENVLGGVRLCRVKGYRFTNYTIGVGYNSFTGEEGNYGVDILGSNLCQFVNGGMNAGEGSIIDLGPLRIGDCGGKHSLYNFINTVNMGYGGDASHRRYAITFETGCQMNILRNWTPNPPAEYQPTLIYNPGFAANFIDAPVYGTLPMVMSHVNCTPLANCIGAVNTDAATLYGCLSARYSGSKGQTIGGAAVTDPAVSSANVIDNDPLFAGIVFASGGAGKDLIITTRGQCLANVNANAVNIAVGDPLRVQAAAGSPAYARLVKATVSGTDRVIAHAEQVATADNVKIKIRLVAPYILP